jgi:hypothetical protein
VNGERFDAAARLLAARRTRRGFLAAAAWTAFAVAAAPRGAAAACDRAGLDRCLQRAREDAADRGVFACVGSASTGLLGAAVGAARAGAGAWARGGPFGLLVALGLVGVAAGLCALSSAWSLRRAVGRCVEDAGCGRPAAAPAAPPANCKARGCADEPEPAAPADGAGPTPADEPLDGCDPPCGPDYACCDGLCWSTLVSGNCGGCGVRCEPGSACCGGSCVPLTQDGNCGSCGVRCGPDHACCRSGGTGVCLIPELWPNSDCG